MNPDLHLLTGAYAVDALEDSERRQFERHLAACPDCAQEVAELRRTAGRLGAAVAADPPDRIRAGVLAEIKRVRQDSPGGLRPIGRRGRPRDTGSRRWVTGLTSVAAAVALALAATFGVVALRAQHQLSTTQAELAQAASRYTPLAQVLGATDMRAESANGTQGGRATAVVSRRLDKGIVVAFDMPPTPSNKTYQAWAIGTGDPRSIGLLAGGGDNSTVPLVLTTLANTTAVAVTLEPAGGSPRPTSRLLISFNLPA
jgi:anti-sigma-K factor RskA